MTVHELRGRARAAFGSPWARRAVSLAAALFTILTLGYLVYRQREVLLQHEWHIRWEMLAAAFAAYSLALYLATWVWVWIARELGVQIHFRRHFLHYCISMLAKRLPGTVWYVAYRAQSYQQEGLPAGLASLGSVVEFAVTLASGIFVSALLAVPLIQRSGLGMWGLGFFLLLAVVILHPRVLGWAMARFGAPNQRIAYRKIITWVIAYAGVRLLSGAIVFFVANSIYPIALSQLGYVIGGWAFVGVLSNLMLFLPTNMGFTEVGFSLVLSTLAPSSMAVIIAVLTRIAMTLFEILWAVLAIVIDKFAKRAG